MKRLTTWVVIAALLLVAADAAAKAKVHRAIGGTNIVPVGLSIDASYDQRFDGFVPGYKVINVAVINQSFNIIFLNPEKDRWGIKLADGSKAITAIHDLRRSAPKAWSELNDKSKDLLAYPLFIPVGARQVIDLFVPESVDAAKFNELTIYIKSLDTKLEIMARQ
ncbi:MAG: hypothetical protein JXA24_05845 [Proteobacteria bacterium]|nr:hypothetical protein [Pseudomonadota bacterium]